VKATLNDQHGWLATVEIPEQNAPEFLTWRGRFFALGYRGSAIDARYVEQLSVEATLTLEERQPTTTIQEDIHALREAGGKAWDDVDDPEEFLGRKS
jgi:hypothetical protein